MSERDGGAPGTGAGRPRVVDSHALRARIGEAGLLVVDMRKPESYAAGHVPGAVRLDYAAIVASRPPAGGMLPDDAQLTATLSGIGLDAGIHVVAYDDAGGGRASRLLWTLDAIGHGPGSLLDGGFDAWVRDGGELETAPVRPRPSALRIRAGETGRADKDYVLARLADPGVAIVDCRSAAEYAGTDKRAERAGHIPGAVHLDWAESSDPGREGRLRPAESLRARFEGAGVTPDREVIAYCQTHHRSSHTYVVLRWLGYPRVRGYEGSWSEWGNDPDVPVER